jgi:enamine deaminase RidA (YjgF/YER057c/UK114 family)
MDITRIDPSSPPGPLMSRVVIAGGMVYVAGLTAGDPTADVAGQMQQVLDRIDGYLAKAGTSKSKLVQTQIWLKDMDLFAEMNAVWNAWVDPDNLPVRACVRADMANPAILVEVMVVATL